MDIVTWNVEEFPKNGQSTVVAVAEILESMDVDLFALQEISGVPDFEQMVGQLPGWTSYMDSKWYGGLAYLYRTDAIEVVANYEIYTTEEFWTPFPRSPQVMEFRFAGDDFVVINNHLKCCGDGHLESGNSWDEEARREHAVSLLKDYVDLHFVDQKVLILGDLNDSLTDGREDNVFGSLLDDAEHYRFADMAIAQAVLMSGRFRVIRRISTTFWSRMNSLNLSSLRLHWSLLFWWMSGPLMVGETMNQRSQIIVQWRN